MVAPRVRVEGHTEMADAWEKMRKALRAYLPADMAEHDTEVIAVAAITSLLALLGESPLRAAAAAVSFSRSALLWLVCRGRRSRGKFVCLLGLSNSGKTLLFMRVSPCSHRYYTPSSMVTSLFQQKLQL